MKEIIVRALIAKDGKFLVCRRKGSDYWFLPGGQIDSNENAKEALARELEEERGSKIEILDFVGVIENFFEQEGEEISEINLIFAVKETQEMEAAFSAEDHLEFKYIALNRFEEENVLPGVIKKGIAGWLRERKPFYLCQPEREWQPQSLKERYRKDKNTKYGKTKRSG